MDDTNPIIKQVSEKLQIVTVLAGIKSFDEINWKQHAQKINSLRRQVEELEKSSDIYKTLLAQLKEVEDELSILNEKKKNRSGGLTRLKLNTIKKISANFKLILKN